MQRILEPPASTAPIVETPIHRRIELARDGSCRDKVFVRCPRSDEWEPIARCTSCASCSHLSTPERLDDWLLLCRTSSANGARTRDVVARRGAVTSAMEPSVLCVALGVPFASLARAMRSNDAEVAVVVDADHCPIGMVTPRDLAKPRGATAGHAMTPYVTALLQDASIDRALDLATRCDLTHIPILSSGRVMGLVSPRSLLEWIAQPSRIDDGHAMPLTHDHVSTARALESAMTLSRSIVTFMTRSSYSIDVDQPLDVAHRMMNEHAIRHLPVLRNGTLVGLLSQRDLFLTEASEPIDTHSVTVEEAMSQDAYAVDPTASLESVAATMVDRKLGCAVVMEGPKVVGLFTTINALRALVATATPP